MATKVNKTTPKKYNLKKLSKKRIGTGDGGIMTEKTLKRKR